MAEEATVTVEAVEEKKKGGFLRKLMKIAVIGAVIAAIVAFVKRRRGDDLDDVEWQGCRRPPAADRAPAGSARTRSRTKGSPTGRALRRARLHSGR